MTLFTDIFDPELLYSHFYNVFFVQQKMLLFYEQNVEILAIVAIAGLCTVIFFPSSLPPSRPTLPI